MTAAALYECTVRHTRTTPIRHAFAYRTYQWFVDLDELPRNRWLASFQAGDHFGDPAATIRRNVEDYLAANGIELGGGQIRLLTNARVFGHVFNPLSVYWCHYADGRLAAVIAEVHNTYGGRHCYLVLPDDLDRAETAKAFYVSPFNEVTGVYRMRLPEPGEHLDLTVALDRMFVATLRGRRRPATIAALLGTAWHFPLVRIHFQGIRLYLRGLRVVPRTAGPRPKGVR